MTTFETMALSRYFIAACLFLLIGVGTVYGQADSCKCTVPESLVWSRNAENSDSIALVKCGCTPFKVQAKVYNRWGEAIAKVDQTFLKWSDFGDKLPSAGTYFFTLAITSREGGEVKTVNGSITILSNG